jgi:toxin ParE1/3/4
MGYNIVVQQEAIIDIQTAYEWYEEKRAGLGDELILEIEDCLQKVAQSPQNYSYINNIFRRIKTSRFPYLIVYEIDGENVIVIAVKHAKRN